MEQTMTKNYLPELLENMQRQLDRIEKTTEKIPGIRTDLDVAKEDIKSLQKARGRKFNFNPGVINLLAIAFVAILFIIAALLHVDLKGIV